MVPIMLIATLFLLCWFLSMVLKELMGGRDED